MKPKNTLPSGLAALAAVLTLTSCGIEPTAAPTPSTSRTTTSTTTTAPTTTTPPATAADGADYASCATRSCEVAVSGPVDIRFGGAVPGALSITGVSPDGVNFNLTMDNGAGGNGTLKPGCSAFSFGSGGGGYGSLGGPNTECTQPPPAQPGTVTLQMPAMTNGTAILRIVTG